MIESSETTAEGWRDKARILIVEDETIVALDMRHRLASLGYKVCDVAATAQGAIDKARDLRPDLILMDIKLKGDADGIEAANVINAADGPPIIFVTAFTDDATLARVRTTSPYGYIVKPFHEREMAIAIELALSKYSYQKSLEKAKNLAEESNRAKSSFLSNISHELKTPLNSILGFIDLALQLTENDELTEYLLFASRGARRLEASINTILDYTKLENKALVPMVTEFIIEDLFMRSWEPYAGDAYMKGLAIGLYIDPALPASLVGDAAKIATILKNLVENAVKFTTRGYVRLGGTRVERLGQSYLHIQISDSGTGIAPHKLAQLFTPFSQGDASYTRLYEGLGLGLSLVKKLTELLNIELKVSFDERHGTCVDLFLPLPAQVESACSLPDHRLAGLRVAMYGLPETIAEDLTAMVTPLGVTCWTFDPEPAGAANWALIYIELAAWAKANQDLRNRLYAAVGCVADRLVILGAPTDPLCYIRRSESFFRRPYPLQPSLVYEDLLRYAGSVNPVGSSQAAPTPAAVSPPDGLAELFEPDAGGDYGRALPSVYGRLLDEAALDMTPQMSETLTLLWHDLRLAFESQDLGLIERTAKRHYDDFCLRQYAAAARFVLTLLMDARKGAGPWIHELQILLQKDFITYAPGRSS